jgi:hypothetical protein
MKLIAHRGNTEGPNPLEENKIEYIEEAIENGFDVEIDIWFFPQTNQFFLGHDKPDYPATIFWLAKNIDKLWIHCKNIDALYEFSSNTSGYNYFWHDTDRYTLTSKDYIWTYPGQSYNPKSIIVMPETMKVFPSFIMELEDMKAYNCYGICSDYVSKMK